MEPEQHPYDVLIEAFTTLRIPRDLLLCEIWLAATLLAIYLPVLSDSFLRVVLGVPLVLFIPGYALIAALFPAARDIDGIERVALSFGLSIAVVPLIGLGLNYTPWGIRLEPILVCLSVFTIGLCLAAQFRRARLPPEERFFVPFEEMKKAVLAEFFLPAESSSRMDRILSLLLLIAIIAAVLTTVYVIVVPKEGEKFTEFFILGEKQKAADYPTSLLAGGNNFLYVGIGNHEYRTINYTVETYAVDMAFDETTNTTLLKSMDLLDRSTVQVAHNQTLVAPYAFRTPAQSTNRIEFLLFNETVPDTSVTGMDRINRSYRDLHLWVKVRSIQ